MNLYNFEETRKKSYYTYMTFLLTSFVLMVLTIIFLIFFRLPLKWWEFLIIAVAAVFLIFIFIILAGLVEKKYLKKYNQNFQDLFVKPLVEDVFKSTLNEKNIPLDFSNIKIINKKHKFKVLNQIHHNDYSIYEITMLKDLRFRGLVIKKKLIAPIDQFMFTNFNYYYKVKIDQFRIKTGIDKFDNRYIMQSENPDFKLPSKMADKLFNKLSTFNQVGVLAEGQEIYYVLGNRLTFRNLSFLNVPLLNEIDEEYEIKLKIYLQKVLSIVEYDLD